MYHVSNLYKFLFNKKKELGNDIIKIKIGNPQKLLHPQSEFYDIKTNFYF